MTFIAQQDLSKDSAFLQRVRVAMLTAATNVQAEAVNTLQALDSAAAATSVTVVSGAVYAVNDLVTFGYGLATVETRKVTGIAGNVLTVSALTNAHKAGEVTQKVIYNHTNRANYAKLVLNAPGSYNQIFSEAVTTNVAIVAASLDSDIQFAVNSLWDALAGVV